MMSDTDLNDGLNDSLNDDQANREQHAGQNAPDTPATEAAATEPATAEAHEDGDDWGAALAEQAARADAPATEAQAFPAITDTDGPSTTAHAQTTSPDMELIADIPVQLSVELGRTRMTIKQILQLGQGSVIELDSLAGQPMDIYINGYLIAQGEVVVVDERYGIRLTDIITPADRLSRLNRQPGRRG